MGTIDNYPVTLGVYPRNIYIIFIITETKGVTKIYRDAMATISAAQHLSKKGWRTIDFRFSIMLIEYKNYINTFLHAQDI